ncbi:MAG: cation-transporting P-type ATPase [Methanolobus sp.]
MGDSSPEIENVFAEYGSSINGLSESEASTRLEKYGKNELEEKEKTTAFKVFARQL